MDLTPYVDRVRQELLIAAEAAGPEGRNLAERLAAPLDSAIRLTLLTALSTATDEITQELAPGSVEVRLRGTDPTFVVTRTPVEPWGDEPHGATVASLPTVTAEDESTTARINFRPPEYLKARIEEAASRDGLSVNAWLVRAVSSVLGGSHSERRPASGGQSFTGWVRG
jgi:hypothetical protein